MEVKELGHVVLFVSDVESSRHFYTDILGFREIRREGQRPNTATYSTGWTHHELYLMQVGEDAQPIPEGPRLGVVPRDVVYSREAGVVPPMPPCGRR